MQNKQINALVVDDEEVMRSLFTDLLTERGYKVTTAKNGREAVEKIKETDYTVVFIDIHMPVMNGVEALKEIKEIAPQLKIVMMDSYPNALMKEAKEKGAVTCIHKPFEIKEVMKIIEEIANPYT